ncbi:MarR family winged helix-turn-helix transcriptional regulator [Azospirillum sp. ST 5-10]|uniref:MarR family winged helix-turn-helix transcriptional regulator n=1 Tax=unclassified Azospirillum TaxID=2630922 RepID=UPI003F49D19E
MTDAPMTGAPRTAAAPTTDDAVDIGLLGNALGFLLKRAQMAVFADFIGAFAAEDIRPAQFSVLVVIERNPGLKQSQVSKVLSIKRTNFVPLLDSLEARGLVKRKPAAGDRRSYALHLTPKGRALTARLTALWEQHEARVRERLGEDGRARLFDLLGRLVDLGTPGEDEADAEAPPPAKPRSARRQPQRAVKADDLPV